MKKLYTLFLALLLSIPAFSQDILNDYSPIIVPKQFSCFNKENKYKSSTLVAMLLRNSNFKVLYSNSPEIQALPDRCKALHVDLVNNSGMFVTKVFAVFKDCNQVEIYRTPIGKSKIKKYEKSFQQAIRNSFESLKSFSHSYNPPISEKKAPEKVVVDYSKDVKDVKETKAKVANAQANKDDKVTKNIIKLEIPLKFVKKGNGVFHIVDQNNQTRFKVKQSMLEGVYNVLDNNNSGLLYKQNNIWFLKDSNTDTIYQLDVRN